MSDFRRHYFMLAVFATDTDTVDVADAEHLPDPDDQSVVYDDLGINDEEREDIHREIETLVSQSGTVGELAAEFLRPRRSGIGLPVLVWAIAAAVFAGGYLYLDYY
ncbi:MAG: hypothetical protein EA382_10730, partial [Spirochaetaceae bacterium]